MGFFKPNIDKLKRTNNIAGLAQHLNHKNPDVRYNSFLALVNRNDLSDDIIANLKNMINDTSAKVRTIAALKFADSNIKKIAASLKEIVNKGTQQEKIDLLRIIAGRNIGSDENIMQIIAMAMLDRKELVKLEAIQTAGATNNSYFIPNLTQCLHDNLPWVRIHAAKAIYKIGGSKNIDHWISLLADPDPDVKKMAQSYLKSTDSEKARNALNDLNFQQLIQGMNGIESSRRETAEKIGKKKIKEGLPLLYTALQDRYREVRITALKAIAEFRDPSSVDHVASLLTDKYQDTRLEAVNTLSRINSKKSLEALENILEESDWNVREEARKAIYKLRPKL